MKLTELRRLLEAYFGPVRAASVAQDHFFSALGDRTIDDALRSGYTAKEVWAAVCESFDVPETMRYGLPD